MKSARESFVWLASLVAVSWLAGIIYPPAPTDQPCPEVRQVRLMPDIPASYEWQGRRTPPDAGELLDFIRQATREDHENIADHLQQLQDQPSRIIL